SRGKKEALELGELYQIFYKSLPITEIAKEFLSNDIFANWLSENSHMPSSNNMPNSKHMTTNNLTEQMNKLIEGQHIGIQPINHFIERLYHIILVQNNIIEETSSQLIFESGQSYQLLQPMLDKLASKHSIAKLDNYYLANILTAHLFNDIEDNKVTLDTIKHDLSKAVIFFLQKCGVTEKDPFHPAKMLAQKTLGVGAPKNYITNNDSMLLDEEIELSNLSNSEEDMVVNSREVLCPLPLSTQKRTTAAIHICKCNISKK
ncbi:37992_t:CDS:2, partial [Gigaspora margarita]